MSKKRTIQTVSSNNNTFGQIFSPVDVTKLQDYAHAHAENITRDFLTQYYQIDVAGFEVAPVGIVGECVALGRIYVNGTAVRRRSSDN